MSTVVGLAQYFFRQWYNWDFLGVASLSELEGTISWTHNFSVLSSTKCPEPWVQELCCRCLNWYYACYSQLLLKFGYLWLFAIVSCCCKKTFKLLFFIFYWAIHFLCSLPFLPPNLLPSLMIPIYSEDLVFFYFPCRLGPCISLLGSSLLSMFSKVVSYRLVFLCFVSKSHLWVSTYDLSFWV